MIWVKMWTVFFRVDIRFSLETLCLNVTCDEKIEEWVRGKMNGRRRKGRNKNKGTERVGEMRAVEKKQQVSTASNSRSPLRPLHSVSGFLLSSSLYSPPPVLPFALDSAGSLFPSQRSLDPTGIAKMFNGVNSLENTTDAFALYTRPENILFLDQFCISEPEGFLSVYWLCNFNTHMFSLS